jgi:IS30 family transposase
MGPGRPGRAPQSEKRQQFARLIAQGASVSEACRVVGVCPNTGTRWRRGRTITGSSGRTYHYAAVIKAGSREISPRYLCEDERVRIADLDQQGLGVRSIAAEVGRSPATVSRELRRNADLKGGRYRPFAAQRLAVQRRVRPGRGKLRGDPVLHDFVAERLKQRWSPEQIARALRREFPDEAGRQLVHETIYQAVYRPELGGLERELPRRVMRTGRRRRRPRQQPGVRRRGSLVGMTMLDQRPTEAADRNVPGHWEGDLITGATNRSAIGTLVERSSRFTILVHLPGGRHGAEQVRDAVVAAMAGLPEQLRRSLTWDQGKEMAAHAEIAAALGMPVFFCDPHSPWQRGSNENTNGLLRQYFPKGSDLRVHDAEHLAAVAAELNGRPRKVLDWDSPADRLATLLGEHGAG